MTTTPWRVDLLTDLCALLPESEAFLVSRMPHDDLMTYIEAYAAARRSRTHLPTELRRQYVDNLIEQIESEFPRASRAVSV